MKRAVIWFLLSCKRCLRKGIFPLLLLLMPLAAFVAGRLSDKEEGEIPVAVSVSGEEDVSERSLAWRLAERLADRKDGMFDFYICSDEAQVRDEVASRRAECGYVIDSGLEEKLDQKQWKRVIRLYMAPSTVAGSISTETVFSELAALYNRNLLMDYVEEGEAFAGMGPVNSSSRAKAAEEAGERYDRWNQEEGLFHFQYIYETNGGGGSEDGVETQSPKSDAAGSIFPGSRSGGRHGFYSVSLRRRDGRRRREKGIVYAFGDRTASALSSGSCSSARSLGLFICFLCAFSGRHGRGRKLWGCGKRAGAFAFIWMWLYGICLWAKADCAFTGASLLYDSVFYHRKSFICPVFVDPGRWIPGMEQLGRLFLPYYYLRCF